MLLLGGTALTERGLAAASRISAATGARLLAETFPARMEVGAGIPVVNRLAYLAERAEAQLTGLDHLILAGAQTPVSSFGYPGRPSDLVPAGCTVTVLAAADQDAQTALEQLADQIAGETSPVLARAAQMAVAPGPLRRAPWPVRSRRRCPSTRSCPTRPTRRGSRYPRRWPGRRGTPC